MTVYVEHEQVGRWEIRLVEDCVNCVRDGYFRRGAQVLQCLRCGTTGKIVTESGQTILEFISKYGGGKNV